jgi:membrane protease YdiL (CAAX protease family)
MLGREVSADRKAWGFWATTAWVAAALVLKDFLFPRLEHLLLDGTAVGKAISSHLALGAVNTALGWFVPILLLLAAVWIRRLPARGYFAWVAPPAGHVTLALAAGAACQLATYAIAYFGGADLTSDAVAQYRAVQSAGEPLWLPLLLTWPSFVGAPLVEESIFRGFLWRGWETSRLGAGGTWLLTSLVFAAYHIGKAADMDPLNGGIALFETLLLGLLLGWLRRRSASTVPGIVAHFAFNVIPPVMTFMIGAILVGHPTGR